MPSRPYRLAREAATKVRNSWRSGDFARRAARTGPVPAEAVAVYFCTGPENSYQFEQWRRPLEHLARRRPVFVLVNRPDTGDLVIQSTSLPVTFAPASAALEEIVQGRGVRVVLYVNQVESNFRMLRFASPVHVQLGHGESDKGTSVSNQHKAYDLVFVGGTAGRERLGRALRGFDPANRTVGIGRPQLDHTYPGAPAWSRGSGLRVWYAPTWEGDRRSIAYGSLVSHGVAMVEALRARPDIRIVYRPHPRSGKVSPSHAAADRRIRSLLRADGDRHHIDQGAYGWQWDFADVCITDISAVAYDWLATGKPLTITQPAHPDVFRPPSRLLDTLALLPADSAGKVAELVSAGSAHPRHDHADLVHYYFGDTTRGASTERFESAIEQAYRLGQR